MLTALNVIFNRNLYIELIETAMFVNDGIAAFDCLWNKISHDCNPDSYVIIKGLPKFSKPLVQSSYVTKMLQNCLRLFLGYIYVTQILFYAL